MQGEMGDVRIDNSFQGSYYKKEERNESVVSR